MNQNERTPLIQTVVVTRREPRYPHSTLRRFCTICLGCLLVVVILGLMLPLLILPSGHHHRPHHRLDPGRDWEREHGWASDQIPATWPKAQGLSYDDLEDILLKTPNAKNMEKWSRYYSAGQSLAGKNLSQALWTREQWEAAGVKTEIVAYDVYINYPVNHRLALLKNDKVEYECSLEEDVVDEDPTTSLEDRIPTFHGYSASGNVTASYVFVNYGTYQDFEDLIEAKIHLDGKIALAKYGANLRGIKIQRAQELGMVGVVIYTDPGDDGEVTEENGYKPYPSGPARNPSSVERGSTQFINLLPGDPTTPGYPSKPGVPREDPAFANPSIPSIPISYQDALPILKALNGHGPEANFFNKDWHKGGLKYKGVNYNIGPTPENLTLNLVNEQEYVTTPIWNVIGIINGTISDEVVVLGNHRDAWIAGGAGDPHSGSTALIEVVRSFGEALSAGWKPMRTIVFASWDGEEYGLLGSTEWVEEYLPWLSNSAIAYLNVDLGAVGPELGVMSAPLLNTLLYETVSMVDSPAGGSVRDHWDGKIDPIGSGSDFCAFLDFAGVPSIDLSFVRQNTGPVYHYHSNYDSYHWMEKFGDTNWEYHVTVAKIWAVMAAKLSETPVIPLNATEYALDLHRYVDEAKVRANKTALSSDSASFDFTSLETATSRLHTSAVAFDTYTASLSAELAKPLPWWKWWQRIRLYLDIRRANTKYKHLERSFLHAEGLDQRTWFKHVVFAPGRWTGYSGERFPGLMESFEDGNLTNARRWSRIIESKLEAAASLLES